MRILFIISLDRLDNLIGIQNKVNEVLLICKSYNCALYAEIIIVGKEIEQSTVSSTIELSLNITDSIAYIECNNKFLEQIYCVNDYIAKNNIPDAVEIYFIICENKYKLFKSAIEKYFIYPTKAKIISIESNHKYLEDNENIDDDYPSTPRL